MQPNQPNPNQNPQQSGYPPQTPQPQGYNPQPATPQPQPQSYPHPQQPAAPQQPNQPQAPTAPNGQPNWYVPPPTKAPEKALSANDYISRTQQTPDPQQAQNPLGTAQPATGKGQYSIDYLNQLSGEGKNSEQFNPKIVIGGIIGFIVLAAAMMFLIFSSSGGPAGPGPEVTLYKTIVGTAEITDDSKKKLHSSDLVSINSSIDILLLNSITGMIKPLSKSGIDADKLESEAQKEEEFAEPMKKLEDARLNAVYDRAYLRIIDFRIDSILLLVEKVNKTSGNSDLKKYLSKTKSDLEVIDKALEEFKKSGAAKI